MSDFRFLRTGFDLVSDPMRTRSTHTRRTLYVLLNLFVEDALRTAARYVRAQEDERWK